MSENEHEETKASAAADESVVVRPTAGSPVETGEPAADTPDLASLMASEQRAEAAKPRPDLDADALRAAQDAIAEGERALAEARSQLATERKTLPDPGARRRELVLRFLLAANVLAMIVVVVMPTGGATPAESVTPVVSTEPSPVGEQAPVVEPGPAAPKLPPKYEQALQASVAGDHARALTLLGEYLEQSPNMAPSRRVTVYRQMAHYAQILQQWTMAQEYERKANMMVETHRLPSDLIAMARAAHEGGDQQALRQVWARFLLQQRQIPSSLYQHVAEAYLQLGDSYRLEANAAAEQARLEELRRTEKLLREQAGEKGGGR